MRYKVLGLAAHQRGLARSFGSSHEFAYDFLRRKFTSSRSPSTLESSCGACVHRPMGRGKHGPPIIPHADDNPTLLSSSAEQFLGSGLVGIFPLFVVVVD